MNIKPLADRVLVRPKQENEESAGGIIIPDTAKEKPQEGEIIAVGEGRISDNGEVIKPKVKKGDRILFSKYAANEITVEDTEYLIMRESDILAVIEK
ncbi:co-chaperone GroES [bacterium]|nr:MAG: co-chaperone GroES [bacterium]